MRFKKERGQKRRLKTLCYNINQIRPFLNTTSGFECFPVPCNRFISSPKTSGKTKSAFVKAWLDKTVDIIEEKPCSLPFCKVVAVINESDLWASQIIIFYDENYYNSFWLRESKCQTWTPITQKGLSFIQKRNIGSRLKEKGYYEKTDDSGSIRQDRLWFYGDI